MLELATFIAKITGMLGNAFHSFGEIQKDQRKRQSQYLDDISETLASAGMAVGDGGDITKQLAELRYHLAQIESVLRLNDPIWEMSMEDATVVTLCTELDIAVGETETSILKAYNKSGISSPEFVQRQKLRNTFLNASGVFRGAAVALRGQI